MFSEHLLTVLFKSQCFCLLAYTEKIFGQAQTSVNILTYILLVSCNGTLSALLSSYELLYLYYRVLYAIWVSKEYDNEVM